MKEQKEKKKIKERKAKERKGNKRKGKKGREKKKKLVLVLVSVLGSGYGIRSIGSIGFI